MAIDLLSRTIDGMTALSIREAALKYDLTHVTIQRWVRAGLVRIEQPSPGPGLPMMICEEDVAKVKRHYVPSRGGRNNLQRLRERVESDCTTP